MDHVDWSPTHIIHWTDSGCDRAWPVRLVLIERASHPWWLAQTSDEHRRAAPPAWAYEAAADRWTWRGRSGFEGRAGTVRCERIDVTRSSPRATRGRGQRS